MKSRIMYIEDKSSGLSGPARFGRLPSRRRADHLLPGPHLPEPKGFRLQSEFYDIATRAEYWTSGPRKDGADRLYGERSPVDIDEDARAEYWRVIRGMPEKADDGIT